MTTSEKFDMSCVVVTNNKHATHGNKRLSMAYGDLNEMPKVIKRIADQIQSLDMSYNRFTNLSFLTLFSSLNTLVLDRNTNLDYKTLPMMEHLEVLWLNNCNLVNIQEWLKHLRVQCPKLKHLSMMCNPVGATILNGVTEKEEHRYRMWVKEIIPQLSYFDGFNIEQHRQMKNNKTKLHSVLKFTKQLHINFGSMDSLLDTSIHKKNRN